MEKMNLACYVTETERNERGAGRDHTWGTSEFPKYYIYNILYIFSMLLFEILV